MENRKRPYNGQPHTIHGIRGKEEVKGLTMRDIADCFVKGVLLASGDKELYEKAEKGTWEYTDVYKITSEIDLLAAQQNMAVEIEKMMDIYPNAPRLKECV